MPTPSSPRHDRAAPSPAALRSVRRPRAPRIRWALRTIVLLGCVAAVVVPTLAPAHDWISPTAATLLEGSSVHRRPAPGWSGMLWAGAAQGAPAAPSAADCRRPPATFDLAGYGAPAEARGERGHVAPAGRVASRAAPPPAAMPAPASTAEVAGAGAPTSPPPARVREDAASSMLAMRDSAAAVERRRSDARTEAPVAVSPARQPTPGAVTRPADEPVSAGMVDDNADFGEYLAYRQRWPQLVRRELDLSARVLLDVRDASGRAVPDAAVRVHAAGRELPLWARTDAGGRTWLMPQRDAGMPEGRPFEIEVAKGGASTRVLWTPGQKDALQARLPLSAASPAAPARLDLVFLVDATGSMGDEIDKLKRSMRAVADQIAQLPTKPDLCFGLVAHRDRGDAFFVRGADLTNDLGAFQRVLEGLQAGGGGDYPEALNEALHTAVHRISWRGEGTARMVVLVADAPPHLDYAGPQYDQDLRAAQARGIKVSSVGASGLDPQGEYILRQLAQFTGGRFVFLTYGQATRPTSGPGRETVHDVRNYSVETLDRLLVRLVSEEMARWPQAAP